MQLPAGNARMGEKTYAQDFSWHFVHDSGRHSGGCGAVLLPSFMLPVVVAIGAGPLRRRSGTATIATTTGSIKDGRSTATMKVIATTMANTRAGTSTETVTTIAIGMTITIVSAPDAPILTAATGT